ncbi:hypothetical protein C8J56DRAFT_895347 [Mycena floridula]|nr:hypothetical protein C8J56DRAFT_895347 [Mycena floridula]
MVATDNPPLPGSQAARRAHQSQPLVAMQPDTSSASASSGKPSTPSEEDLFAQFAEPNTLALQAFDKVCLSVPPRTTVGATAPPKTVVLAAGPAQPKAAAAAPSLETTLHASKKPSTFLKVIPPFKPALPPPLKGLNAPPTAAPADVGSHVLRGELKTTEKADSKNLSPTRRRQENSTVSDRRKPSTKPQPTAAPAPFPSLAFTSLPNNDLQHAVADFTAEQEAVLTPNKQQALQLVRQLLAVKSNPEASASVSRNPDDNESIAADESITRRLPNIFQQGQPSKPAPFIITPMPHDQGPSLQPSKPSLTFNIMPTPILNGPSFKPPLALTPIPILAPSATAPPKLASAAASMLDLPAPPISPLSAAVEEDYPEDFSMHDAKEQNLGGQSGPETDSDGEIPLPKVKGPNLSVETALEIDQASSSDAASTHSKYEFLNALHAEVNAARALVAVTAAATAAAAAEVNGPNDMVPMTLMEELTVEQIFRAVDDGLDELQNLPAATLQHYRAQTTNLSAATIALRWSQTKARRDNVWNIYQKSFFPMYKDQELNRLNGRPEECLDRSGVILTKMKKAAYVQFQAAYPKTWDEVLELYGSYTESNEKQTASIRPHRFKAFADQVICGPIAEQISEELFGENDIGEEEEGFSKSEDFIHITKEALKKVAKAGGLIFSGSNLPSKHFLQTSAEAGFTWRNFPIKSRYPGYPDSRGRGCQDLKRAEREEIYIATQLPPPDNLHVVRRSGDEIKALMDSKLPALIYRPMKPGMIPRAVFLDGSEQPEAPLDPESYSESQEAPRILQTRKPAAPTASVSAPESDDEDMKTTKKKKPSKSAKKPPVVKAAGATKAAGIKKGKKRTSDEELLEGAQRPNPSMPPSSMPPPPNPSMPPPSMPPPPNPSIPPPLMPPPSYQTLETSTSLSGSSPLTSSTDNVAWVQMFNPYTQQMDFVTPQQAAVLRSMQSLQVPPVPLMFQNPQHNVQHNVQPAVPGHQFGQGMFSFPNSNFSPNSNTNGHYGQEDGHGPLGSAASGSDLNNQKAADLAAFFGPAVLTPIFRIVFLILLFYLYNVCFNVFSRTGLVAAATIAKSTFASSTTMSTQSELLDSIELTIYVSGSALDEYIQALEKLHITPSKHLLRPAAALRLPIIPALSAFAEPSIAVSTSPMLSMSPKAAPIHPSINQWYTVTQGLMNRVKLLNISGTAYSKIKLDSAFTPEGPPPPFLDPPAYSSSTVVPARHPREPSDQSESRAYLHEQSSITVLTLAATMPPESASLEHQLRSRGRPRTRYSFFGTPNRGGGWGSGRGRGQGGAHGVGRMENSDVEQDSRVRLQSRENGLVVAFGTASVDDNVAAITTNFNFSLHISPSGRAL